MDKRYRKPLIAGNWKMNLLPSEVPAFSDALEARGPHPRPCETVICAPHTHLSTLQRAAKGTRLLVGAQDVSMHEAGAYTGQVSAAMLADLGVRFVIVGHSERRTMLGETDFIVAAKLRAALAHGLSPILCVGETLTEREAGVTLDRITLQLRTALSGLDAARIRQCVIAYEPIWAIGTGQTADPEQAQEVCRAIRRILRGDHGAITARAVRILYGGSMNPDNARALLAQPDIDGGLIGGASLTDETFAAILAACDEEAAH